MPLFKSKYLTIYKYEVDRKWNCGQAFRCSFYINLGAYQLLIGY